MLLRPRRLRIHGRVEDDSSDIWNIPVLLTTSHAFFAFVDAIIVCVISRPSAGIWSADSGANEEQASEPMMAGIATTTDGRITFPEEVHP